MGGQDSSAARDAILQTVRGIVRSDPRAGRAFNALRAKGFAPSHCEVEIALALICCIWETSRGMADRFAAVCDGLASGFSVDDLCPTSLQDSRRTARAYVPPRSEYG
ncbi:MAG: hypothetical protein ABSD74_09335 [Rhizomicrobium sp.]